MTPPAKRLREESGQIMPLLLVGVLVVMLGFAAFAIDVGHAYVVDRQLQASADAAALAGATALPDAGVATAMAESYGPSGRNPLEPGTDPRLNVATRCLKSVRTCSEPNAVVVKETAEVKTTFAKLFGVDSFQLHAEATACSPCSERPLDVMVVLDRTGSMCTTPSGANDPACTDLNNAREGMKTFLRQLDPQLDHVGLAVLPPAMDISSRCDKPPDSASYDSPSAPYVVVPLSDDYLVGGEPNERSDLVSTIECVQANGWTSYATALEKAQAELLRDGRSGAQRVIVFLSDGAANGGPAYYAAGSPYVAQPCHQGIASAAAITSAGTTVFSIGYDLEHDRCQGLDTTTGRRSPEQPGITAVQALQGIASSSDQFYNQPTPGQLDTIFTRIAADILSGQSKLVDDDS